MEKIEVEARGWKAPVCDWFEDVTCVRLRIDDEKQPELWMTVTIPLDLLRAIVGSCEAAGRHPEGGVE